MLVTLFNNHTPNIQKITTQDQKSTIYLNKNYPNEAQLFFNQKNHSLAKNLKEYTSPEKIQTDIIIHDNQKVLDIIPYLNLHINQDIQITVQEFSFNSDSDYITLKLQTPQMGLVNLSDLKIIYNQKEITNNFQISSPHLKNSDILLFNQNLELTIQKNFNIQSQFQISYKDQLIIDFCTENKQQCQFQDLAKHHSIKHKQGKWIYLNPNKVPQNTPQANIQFKLNKNSDNSYNINILPSFPTSVYQITQQSLLINQKPLDTNKDINLTDNIQDAIFQYQDNLSNQYQVNITEDLKKFQTQMLNLIQNIQDPLQAIIANQTTNNQKNTNNQQQSSDPDSNTNPDPTPKTQTAENNTTKAELTCPGTITIHSLLPQPKAGKKEIVILKNLANTTFNLEHCELKDQKNNLISLPKTINKLETLHIESNNILNNSGDTIYLIDKHKQEILDSCEYNANQVAENQYISCNQAQTANNNPDIKVQNPEQPNTDTDTNTETKKDQTPPETNTKVTPEIATTQKAQPHTNINIKITEVMANPIGSDKNQEWIEVQNQGSEEFHNNLTLKTNQRQETLTLKLKPQEIVVINPQNTLRNTDLKITLLYQGQTLDSAQISKSLEGESFVSHKDNFISTKYVSKGEINPEIQKLKCKITEINLNLNSFICNQQDFFYKEITNLTKDQVEIEYIFYNQQNNVLKIIQSTDTPLINYQNAGFTILSIGSLLLMHKLVI